VPSAPNELEALSLLVIPHSAQLAYVWCPLSNNAIVTKVQTPVGVASILERRKLFQPGRSFEVLLIESSDLRDGISCDLSVTSTADGTQTLAVQARLARWDEADTRRVLKFIAKRFDTHGEPPHTLARYLDLISAWQAPGRIIETFAAGQIVEIDVACEDGDLDAYAVTPHGLRGIASKPLLFSSQTCTLWLGDETPRVLYLDVSGELIRSTLQSAKPQAQTGSGAHASIDSPTLIDALHEVAVTGSAALYQWAAKRCQSRVRVRADDVTFEVLGAVRLPADELAVFVGIKGLVTDLGDFHLQSFGALDAAEVTVFSRDTDVHADDAWQTQIVIKAALMVPEARCHRLTWAYRDETFSVWIRETECSHPVAYELGRDFLPVANVHAEVFPTILHPLATSAGLSAPGLLQKISFGPSCDSAQADIFVFAGPDLEALHRTVLSLSLTSRETRCAIHICLFDLGPMNQLVPRIEQWTELYDLSLHIRCYSSRTAEAQVAEQELKGGKTRVFCRAGVVPRRADWLAVVLETLENKPEAILVGTCNTVGSGPKATRRASHPHHQWVNEADNGIGDSIFVAAVTAGLHSVPEASSRFFVLESFLTGLAIHAADTGMPISTVMESLLVPSGAHYAPDPFQAKLDAYSLQESIMQTSTAQL
jgi:hypothetical protein